MDAFAEENIPSRVSEWRKAYFRRQLYETTYRHFLKTKEDIRNMSPELLEEMGLDSEADEDIPNMQEWPEYFEVSEVPKLMK